MENSNHHTFAIQWVDLHHLPQELHMSAPTTNQKIGNSCQAFFCISFKKTIYNLYVFSNLYFKLVMKTEEKTRMATYKKVMIKNKTGKRTLINIEGRCFWSSSFWIVSILTPNYCRFINYISPSLPLLLKLECRGFQ